MLRRISWLSIVVALAGCAPGNPGIVVLNSVSPDEQCMYEVSGASVAQGRLDVAQPAGFGSYTLIVRFANQLLNLGQSGASGIPMADPNLVRVREAEIEIRDIAGDPIALGGLPNPFRWPASGFAASSDGSTTGEGLATIQVLPAAYVDALSTSAGSTIVVAVRVIGQTEGGAEIESSEFEWPIELCAGCLFACVEEEGVAQCIPSCTPGQDRVTVSPAACDGIAAGC